jgi:hypothetical protein
MSSLRNLEKGPAFPAAPRLDLDKNDSVSLPLYFYYGLLAHQ